MADEKSFLQNIKLELSKNLKLTPYERIAFHKILGLHDNESTVAILTADLDKGPLVRKSAVASLVGFKTAEATGALVKILEEENLNPGEAVLILKHIGATKNIELQGPVSAFIERRIDDEKFTVPVSLAFTVLASIGTENDDARGFILGIINNPEIVNRHLAISALSAFRITLHYENLLKTDDDAVLLEVYHSLYRLSIRILDQMASEFEDETLFTYSPEQEDKIILDLRVLMGKMTHRFDSYSNRVKVIFVSIMMSCNHREYLVYAMKGLTSQNMELVHMMLFGIYANITRLRDPDKLFRNLISLSTESDEDNRLTVATFVKYFSMKNNSRQFHLLKDKLFSYIVVTLESYFETYRKDFMITDVAEKSFPENFQLIRQFILERFNVDLKKKLVSHLNLERADFIKHILSDIGSWVQFIDDREIPAVQSLLEILIDDDQKSRDNSGTRLEDINFEKRYLRNRILRLCEIVTSLSINEAASPLINIYNYLKKYPDKKIYDAVVRTLSSLDYSYMLGELEVMLGAGSNADRWYGLNNLALFSEQRSLNILFEFIRLHHSDDDPILTKALDILMERDIDTNITAQQLLHAVIESNINQETVKNAVISLGQCGIESDVEYLNNLFQNDAFAFAREEIIRSMGMLLPRVKSINKKQLIRIFQNFLKDPGIRVRIYASLFLIQLGDENAIRTIKDMLVIKNKSIQRDILTVLGDLKSIDFSFFLISMATAEYGIINDILPLLKQLPEQDSREIDGFIINTFRKYEAPAITDERSTDTAARPISITLDGAMENEKTILAIELINRELVSYEINRSTAISRKLLFKKIILSIIDEKKGTVAHLTPSGITVVFSDPATALDASILIRNRIESYNLFRRRENQVRISIQVITDTICYLNDELISYPSYRLLDPVPEALANRILCDGATVESIAGTFIAKKIPGISIPSIGLFAEGYEIINPVNFAGQTGAIYDSFIENRKNKNSLNEQIEEKLRKIKLQVAPASSASATRQLEEIGGRLRDNLDEIEKYIQRRSTDRELLKNVRKLLDNVLNQYRVEISRLIIK